MGVKAPIHTGAEFLAKKFDLAVVFMKTKKIKRGYYETAFKTITLKPTDFDDYQITDKFLTLVEEQIKEKPEYYFWTHKRWKHSHEIEDELKRRVIKESKMD